MTYSLYNILNNLALLVISVSLTLSGCEIYLHLSGYKQKDHSWIFQNEEFIQNGDYRNFFTLDAAELYKPKPNTIIIPDYWETDKYGFRRNPQHTGTESRKRILVIGDSYAYGHGVSNAEAWPAVLETLLQNQGEPMVVHNAAVPATGTDQQYVRLRKLLPIIRPNLVLWSVSYNDMIDSNNVCLFRKQYDGSYQEYPAVLNVAYINAFLTKYLPKWFIRTDIGNLFTTFSYNGKDLATYGCSVNIKDSELIPVYFDKLAYLLARAQKEVVASGASLAVVFTPKQYYFDKSKANDDYEIDFLHFFIDAFKKAGVRYYDLNSQIALSMEPDLYTYRSGNQFTQSNLSLANTADVLGTSSSQLDRYLFLSETDMPYGGMHINTAGSAVVARAIFADVSGDHLLEDH